MLPLQLFTNNVDFWTTLSPTYWSLLNLAENFLLENRIKKKLHSFLGLFFERSTYNEPTLEMNTKIKTLHVLIELVSEAFLVDKVFYAGTKIKQEIYLSGKLHSGYFRENSDSSLILWTV